MASIHRTLLINRPVSEVFDYFADVANDPQWRGDGLKEIAVEGVMGQGARVHQILAGPFGVAVTADMDVVVFDPPRELLFQVVTGPLKARMGFSFAAVDAGTEVSFSIEAPMGTAEQAMIGKIVEKNMKEQAAALDNAKHILES